MPISIEAYGEVHPWEPTLHHFMNALMQIDAAKDDACSRLAPVSGEGQPGCLSHGSQ